MKPTLVALSTGTVQSLTPGSGRDIPSAIQKSAVSTLSAPHPVRVLGLGLEGDEQADHRVHGGVLKALYAYPREHYDDWADEIFDATGQRPTWAWGQFGENLTVEGLREAEVYVGDRWRIGSVEIEVVAPREPCFKFNIRMHYRSALRYMLESGQCGWYLKVNQPGSLHAGQSIDIMAGPRELSIRQLIDEVARQQGVTPRTNPFR